MTVVNPTFDGDTMKILTAIAILGVLSFGSHAQARTHRHAIRPLPRPLVVYVAPPPFGDRYAFFSPSGPTQLSAPFHTLCGFSLATECSQESSYGP